MEFLVRPGRGKVAYGSRPILFDVFHLQPACLRFCPVKKRLPQITNHTTTTELLTFDQRKYCKQQTQIQNKIYLSSVPANYTNVPTSLCQ